MFTKTEVDNDIARVWPKESGSGIKLDPDNPSFVWRDLDGPVIPRTTGGGRPVLASWLGNIEAFQFSVGNVAQNNYHPGHDWVPNHDCYIHAHWDHNSGASPTGDVTWEFEVTYAKGYEQMAFVTPIVTTVTQAISPTAHTHHIAEVPLSSLVPSASLLDSALIEPDGLFIVRTKLLSNTTGVNPFLHFVDIHYQSTGVGTINRNYPFYGA